MYDTQTSLNGVYNYFILNYNKLIFYIIIRKDDLDIKGTFLIQAFKIFKILRYYWKCNSTLLEHNNIDFENQRTSYSTLLQKDKMILKPLI